MPAPHPARFIQVRKAPLQLLAPLPQQPLPPLAPNPPPVGVHRRLLFLLPLPAPPSPLRLRAVAAHLPLRQLRQHFVAVVSLVQHHFLRPFRIHSLARLLTRDRGDLLARFTHRLPHARRIAPVGRLQRDRHHRSAAEVHRLLHLVRQVRALIFHLGDARVGIVRVLPLLIRPFARTLPVQPRQLLPRRRRNP